MNSSIERRFQRVQDNARASLSRRLTERRDSIISRMITEYRSGTLTSEKLFGMAAAISELKSILDEAERDLMQATDDAVTITQPTKDNQS